MGLDAELIEHFAQTKYACSRLDPVSEGMMNFTFRAELLHHFLIETRQQSSSNTAKSTGFATVLAIQTPTENESVDICVTKYPNAPLTTLVERMGLSNSSTAPIITSIRTSK